MLLLDLLADIVKTQFMIDLLNKSCWRVLNNDFLLASFSAAVNSATYFFASPIGSLSNSIL